VIARNEGVSRLAGIERFPDFVVDRLVDRPHCLHVAGTFVKHRIGGLELDESKVGIVSVGEKAKRLAAGPDEIAVVRDHLAPVGVARPLVGRVDPIAADLLADFVKHPFGMTSGVLGCGIPWNQRSGKRSRGMGHWNVDDDARQSSRVEQFPEGGFAQMGRVHDVPVVPLEGQKRKDPVFAGVGACEQGGPRARGPGRDLGFERAARALL